MTNTLSFQDPEEYPEYVRRFGISGVSISGGEPIMSFETSVRFLSRIRERLGDGVHLWMYTNGILVDETRLRLLADAGLNEIRFNITATGYSLKQAQRAVGIIDAVTVEISAVPEELRTLETLMPQMADAGIKYLNLHQLRLTLHNAPRLFSRGYSFLHGPKVAVLESEYTALRLLSHAAEARLALNVNYCSSIYRYIYQTLGFRRRAAAFIRKPFEALTATGLLREIFFESDISSLDKLRRDLLDNSGIHPDKLVLEEKRRRLKLHPDCLIQAVDRGGLVAGDWFVRYSLPLLKDEVSYLNPCREVAISTERSVIVERKTMSEPQIISSPDMVPFVAFLGGNDGEVPPAIRSYETVPFGLYPYY